MMTVLLDGAMGTELARRGFELRAPLWGARAIADAPGLVTAVHRDYVRAGAEAIVTASFGLGPGDAALAEAAVRLARDATAGDIVGSIGPADPTSPLEDQRCHYARLGEALRDGGAAVLFAETQTTLAGARLAAETLRPLGLPVWVALACDRHGLTLGGDDLHCALPADAVFVGCTEHPGLLPALEALAPSNPVLGLRPSLALTTQNGFQPAGATEAAVAQAIVRCTRRFDVRYAGGCCGTTPAFIAALAEALA